MALESQKQDRSYQYGRLLAVLEKEERETSVSYTQMTMPTKLEV